MAQTAIDWLIDKIKEDAYVKAFEPEEWLQIYEQAKVVEREQRIKDYNAGYDDGSCNHINDAENYISESEYMNDKEINDYIIGPFGTPEKK